MRAARADRRDPAGALLGQERVDLGRGHRDGPGAALRAQAHRHLIITAHHSRSRRQPRALGERAELLPHHRRVHLGVERRAGGEPAVRAGDDVLPADDPGVQLDGVGDQLGVLDVVGGVPEQARDEDLALGQRDVPPDLPLVLVARVRDLERVRAGVDLQHERRDVAEGQVVDAGAVVEAVAGVQADLLGRDVAQRVVEDLDVLLGVAAALLGRRGRVLRQVLDQPRVVDLQQEPGVDDRRGTPRAAPRRRRRGTRRSSA